MEQTDFILRDHDIHNTNSISKWDFQSSLLDDSVKRKQEKIRKILQKVQNNDHFSKLGFMKVYLGRLVATLVWPSSLTYLGLQWGIERIIC